MPNTLCNLRDDAAKQVLKGLREAGASVVKRARSPHASDCSCAEGHTAGTMRQCRCVRVCRLRGPRTGDWLLVFGDCAEGPTMKLQGPYTEETPLHYGGGFWEQVHV